MCAATGAGIDYPCAFFEFAGIPGFVVHGPMTIYALEQDGTSMLVTPYWGHEPLPTDNQFAEFDELVAELVSSIRFVE
jgi:hypothetical protein